MIRYRPIKMRHPIAGYTYGIIGEEGSGDEWSAVAIVPDVCCDWLLTMRLAEKCTKGQLSPMQLLDVVTDSLP